MVCLVARISHQVLHHMRHLNQSKKAKLSMCKSASRRREHPREEKTMIRRLRSRPLRLRPRISDPRARASLKVSTLPPPSPLRLRKNHDLIQLANQVLSLRPHHQRLHPDHAHLLLNRRKGKRLHLHQKRALQNHARAPRNESRLFLT